MSFLAKLFGRKPVAITTGHIYSSRSIIEHVGYPVHVADNAYAEVSAEWLREFYQDFRKTLFREGVTKWDATFDCDNFASLYVGLANLRFFVASFHSATTAQSLALAEYWYRQGGDGPAHAVVHALTNRGPIFIEPQSGSLLPLTPAEQASRLFVKF